ncbi:LOW QUALITY PROTEIN: hypothetical protein PHMEG_00014542 [Phytophthora megakarya]|uniref:Uncharacterized protein n=1 Tax=Phytophthora megakarya TaxID=4795 RepID=A0A225W431_9STRA|nr:LOW QUALITY PROTEIN: hypothetical protein PHMEG_00014542 [Phytophthora megakarya]
MNTVARDPEEPEIRPEQAEETHSDLGSEVKILDPENVAGAEDNVQAEEPSVDVQSQTNCSTPVQMLEAEYARVMRVSAEELDLKPAVYLREGSDLMAQLRDQLIMLPEIEELTPECNIDEANVGGILKRHRSIFLGDGNAAPAPARGVVCDVDVGEAKPVALRARQIAAPFLVKVSELLKKSLEAELIEYSESEWSSSIVNVLKKNGVDIRMCIDYRLLNLLIKLSRYPLPLIDDLLVDFKSTMWFMRLDMASGFWAVRMTERAKLISAFVCPFGHFQWLRMPFGLKNAPLIYQSIINNCLWGFARLPPEEEAMVDPEVLESLDLEPQETLKPEVDMMDSEIPSLDMTVFLRNIPAPSQMGPVLARSSYIDDIAHGASTWDHYDLPEVAAVLYELDKERVRAGRSLEAAKESFEILKRKIMSTPLLRHPDRDKPFVIIPHANVACAVLGQEHEGLTHPVRCTGKVLKESELRYHIAEKEVLAILRTLEVFRPLIHGSEFPVVVYTRYSVLKWLLESNTADGRHLKWGLELSRWTLEIHRTQKDEDGLAAILGSGITPREHLDKVAETLIPAKGRLKVMPPVSLEMSEAKYHSYVLSFDGAATIVKAEEHILEGLTVNDAEYHSLILGLQLAMKYDVKELVAVGDSRIVVQQAQGLINCNKPNLQRRLAEYEDLRKDLVSVKLIHIKREFNQATDHLTSKTLVLGESW